MAQWAACRAEPQQLGQFPLPTSLHPSPTVSVSPQLYHANRIESANTKRLNLWLSFSRTVLCLFVCQGVLSWPHPQYLITFFLLFFLSLLFPNQRAAIRHLISQKRRALQPFQNKSLEKTCPCARLRGQTMATVRNSAESVQMCSYFKKVLLWLTVG